MTRALATLLALILMHGALSGCAVVHYYGPRYGKVVDEATGEPIDAAAVVAVYETVSASVGGEVHSYADAQETRTDEQGLFRMPGKLVFRPKLPISWFDSEVEIYIFKPTYKPYESRYVPPGPMIDEKRTEYRLRKLETLEEQRRHVNYPSRVPTRKMPYYLKLYNEQSRNLGLDEIPVE